MTDSTLIAALRYYDCYLWAKNYSLKRAKAFLAERDLCDAEVSVRRLGKLAKENCTYFRQGIRMLRKSKRTLYESHEWDRMTAWVRENPERISRETDTPLTVMCKMLYAGIRTSPWGARQVLDSCGVVLPDEPVPFKP